MTKLAKNISMTNGDISFSTGIKGKLMQNVKILFAVIASLLLSGLLLMGVPSAALSKKIMLEDIELVWKPTTQISALTKLDLGQLDKAKIKVGPFEDKRKIVPKNKIGENKEDKNEYLPVLTTSDIPVFFAESLRGVFSQLGTKIVSSSAPFVLQGDLEEFYVAETENYETTVRVRFSLGNGERTLWSKTYTSVVKRSGRSYKLDNYLESYSDAIMDLVSQLLQNKEFIKFF